MEDQKNTYQTFEDLDAYKVSREFRKAMYQIAGRLPESEKFGLAPQVRRAAVSLTDNVAEGHGRFHYADQIKFILQARGSLEELLDELNVCQDENYLDGEEIKSLREQGWRVHKVLNGYIRFLRNRKSAGSTRVAEDDLEYLAAGSDAELRCNASSL